MIVVLWHNRKVANESLPVAKAKFFTLDHFLSHNKVGLVGFWLNNEAGPKGKTPGPASFLHI